MKSWSPFQKALAWILGIVLSFILLINVIQMTSPALGQSDPGYRFWTLLHASLIERPISSMAQLTQKVSTLWKVETENDLLRQKIEQLSLYQAKLEESYREIEALKQLNQLKTTYSQYTLINGSILRRSNDTFTHILTLDIGSKDGVAIDDAVISSKGLVGKVIEVTDSSSVVLLLTTENELNKVMVKIQVDAAKTSEAILEKYDPNVQSYVLTLIDTSSSITEGMRVVSSGLGGAFPSGLLVGEVSKVETLVDAIGLRIEVKPAADFLHLDYLSVVKRGE